MMSDSSNREYNLTFRATDLSSQPVAALTSTVKTLISTLGDQVKAAASGAASIGEFKKSLNDAGTAVNALVAQKSALSDFTSKQDLYGAALEKVTAAQERYNTVLSLTPAKDERSTSQEKALGLVERALTRAVTAEGRAQQAYERSEQRLGLLGVATTEVASAQKLLSTTLDDVVAAYRRGQEADTQFINNKKKAVEYILAVENALERERIAAETDFNRNKELSEAALVQQEKVAKRTQEIAEEQRRRRGESLQNTFGPLVEQAAEAEKAYDRAFGEAIKLNERFNEQRAEADAKAIEDAKALVKFQEIGYQALARAAAGQTAAPGPAAATIGASAQVGASTSGVSRPGNDVADAQAALDKLDESLKKSTLFGSSYARQMDQVYAVQRKLAGDATLIDNFEKQANALKFANDEMEQAQAEFTSLSIQVGRATVADDDLLRSLRQAEQAFNRSSAEVQRQSAALGKLRTELRAAKVDENELAAETARLTAQGERLTEIAGRASKGKTSLFGLEGYQLKNLEYQVGDVITQLSLGQGVLRTFDSQADQIFQIFDVSIARLKLLALYALPAAVALGALYLVLSRYKEGQDSIREFNARLTVSADGVRYSAREMLTATQQIEKYGVSFSDARQAVEEFVGAGLRTDKITTFGKLAQNISDVFGTKFSDNVKEVTTAFTSGYDGIVKLNDKYNVFSAAQLKLIKDNFDLGKSQEAVTMAFDITTARFSAAADLGVTKLTIALRDLTTAWHDFLDEIGKTGAIQGLVGLLGDTLKLVTALTRFSTGDLSFRNFVKELGPSGDGRPDRDKEAQVDAQANLDKLLAQKKGIEDAIANQATLPAMVRRDISDMRGQLAEIEGRIVAAQAKVNEVTAKLTPSGQSVESMERTIASLTRRRADVAAGAVTPISVGDAITGKESGGRANATNSQSSATGQDQFIEGTWLDQISRNFPELGRGKSRQEILDLRKNPTISGQVRDRYTQENATALGKAGNEASPTNLALAHYVGAGGANAVLGAAPNTPVSSILDADAIARNPKLGTQTASQLIAQQALLTKDAQTAAQLDQTIALLNRQIAANGGAAPYGPQLPGVRDQSSEAAQSRALGIVDANEKRYNELRDRNLHGADAEEADKRATDEIRKQLIGAAGDSATNPAVLKTINDIVDKEIAIRKEKRDKYDQEQAAKRLAEETALQDTLLAIRAKVDNADKTNVAARLRAIDEEYAKIDAVVAKAKLAGVTSIGGQSFEDFGKAIEAQKDSLKSQAIAEGNEAAVTKLLDARTRDYKDITDQLERGGITLAEAFTRATDVTTRFAPKLGAAVSAAKAAIGGLPASPATVDALSKVDAVRPGENGAQDALFRTGFQEVDKQQAVRTNAVKEQKALVDNGLSTTADAQAAVSKAYDQTRDASLRAIATLREQTETAHKLGQINDTVYDSQIAKLKLAEAETVHLDDFQKQLIKTIEGSVVSGATKGFDTIGQSLGNLVAGTGKLKDVFTSVGLAFSSFASGFLKDIANMILKTALLNATQSAFGKGGFGSSLLSGLGGLLGLGGSTASSVTSGVASASGAASASAGLAGSTGGFSSLLGLIGLAHSGGTVGSPGGQSRLIHSSVMENARRYHQGGIASNEVPTILESGEKVISNAQQRAEAAAASQGGGGPMGIRQVLAIGDKEISGAMVGAHGEQVVLTHLKNNIPTLKNWIG